VCLVYMLYHLLYTNSSPPSLPPFCPLSSPQLKVTIKYFLFVTNA
jgi:hypothetical protein